MDIYLLSTKPIIDCLPINWENRLRRRTVVIWSLFLSLIRNLIAPNTVWILDPLLHIILSWFTDRKSRYMLQLRKYGIEQKFHTKCRTDHMENVLRKTVTPPNSD